jgi:general secretion pathway protein K
LPGVRDSNRSGERGIALVTTLLIIALLVAVTVEFNRNAVADIEVTSNFVDEKKILYTTISGVNALKELLMLDSQFSKADTLFEEWNQGEAYFASASSLLEEGTVTGDITDEDGKICVNTLVNAEGSLDGTQSRRWERLLSQPQFGLIPEEIFRIIHGVKDWIDPDNDVSGIYGAENSYYRGKGVRCKNGPMDTIEEMLLVRGVTEEIFFGDKYREGIRPCFTVYGDGSININTAPVPVLLALSENMNQSVAKELDDFRRDPTNRGRLREVEWYRTFWPYEELLPEKSLKTTSSFFSVWLQGKLRESTKRVRAVIQRTTEDARIVYWQETAS